MLTDVGVKSATAGRLMNAGPIRRRQRLGGMLNYYYRAAA
jgi:hypothetical protein